MSKAILIADSGSTKTDWIMFGPEAKRTELHTVGINPARDARDIIYNVLYHDLLPQLPQEAEPQDIYFYGAGCIEPFSQNVKAVLEKLFPKSHIEVESDLLCAARALCGHEPGIACILGTGSNSCLYNGTRIVRNTPPLGYILGDEGSGSFLGKTLLNALFKGRLSETLCKDFSETFQLTLPDVIQRVYRQPSANAFLASLVPFMAKHRQDPAVHAMLIDAFCLFFEHNILPYGHREMPVHCVGGIAFQFETELKEAAAAKGMNLGKIVRRPADEVLQYHLQILHI